MDSILDYFSLSEKLILYNVYFLIKCRFRRNQSIITDSCNSMANNSTSSIDINRQIPDENENCTLVDDTSDDTRLTNPSENERTLAKLMESIQSAATEMNDKDFLQMIKEVRNNQEQVQLLQKFISEMSKNFEGKRIGLVDFHQSIDELKKYCSNLESYKVNVDLFYPEIPKIMAFLKEKNLLPLEQCREYMNICKKKGYIHSRLAEYNAMDHSMLLDLMITLQEIGLLSGEVLSRYRKITDETNALSMEVGYLIDKMQDLSKNVFNIGAMYQKNWLDLDSLYFSEAIMNFFSYCWECDSSELSEAEIEMLLDKIGKEPISRICRSEHKIPFCGLCGWRTSWLKAFKKRGVYIKEDACGASENIWHIKVDKR